MPTALLIDPVYGRPRLRDAEVKRVRDAGRKHPVGPDHRRDMRGLDRDLEVAVVELLEQLDLLQCGGDERFRLILLGEPEQMLRQRPRVGADPHRDPGPLGRDHDLGHAFGAADVPRVDSHRRHAGVDRPEREAGVEVDVRDHRQRREPHDLLQRLGVLDLRHRAAHDLAARRGERGDLRGRRGHVARRCQRHRLDDDRRTAADLDVAYLDAAFGTHANESSRAKATGLTRRLRRRPSRLLAPRCRSRGR